MIDDGTQLWRDGRPCFPGREVVSTRALEVEVLRDDATAKAFVARHHYSGTFPAARERLALRRSGELVGVAVFSVPMAGAVLDVLPCARDAAVELGRLVLLDDDRRSIGANAESWFVARAFDYLRGEGYEGVVSFSDPQPRLTTAGDVVLGGHVGTIYQALSARYTGRGRARWLWLLSDGRVFSERAIAKIRARHRGWRYAAAQLEAARAAPLRDDEDARAWLARELPRVCRRIKHRGNHRYVWGLSRAVRRTLDGHLSERGIQPMPYPKQVDPL